MTLLARRVSRAGNRTRRDIDAVTLLSCYLFLLMAIPAFLVVGAFGAAGPPATLFGGGLLGLYLVTRPHPDFPFHTGHQPARAAAIFFGCSILAAYAAANRAAMAGPQSNGADRGLILLAGWLGVLLLAADGIDQADRLAVLLRRVVAGATAMAALGLAEFITGVDYTKYATIPGLQVHVLVTDLMTREGLVRVNSTASQPLEFSAVLAMCLPLAIHHARHAPARLRLRRWGQAGLIAATIPMAVSRTQILGLAAIAAILLPSWPAPERRRAYLAIAAFPVLLYLTRPGMMGSLLSTFGQLGSDTSTTSRSGALDAAVPLISQHPWFGMGFQTFFPQTYFFIDDQFLTMLIETGIVGLAALVTLFVTGLYLARSARRIAPDPQAADLARSLTAAMTAAAISFATLDVLSFPIASGIFFLLIGCTGATWRLARGPASARVLAPSTMSSG
jgi:O-antigen ligase